MDKRNFEEWLKTFTDSVATWGYYTDFEKVYKHVNELKIELNILNSLIGSNNIEQDFRNIVSKYPETLKCIPILLAKRESEILIRTPEKEYNFNFKKMNYSVDEYVEFMDRNGLFNLLKNHLINNYFKEMYKRDIEKKWGIDLSAISNNGKTEKRFDFVIKTNDQIYGIEVNFYSGGGSKLNETARSYKNIALEAEHIDGFSFVWFTDGEGWHSAKRNLQETFDIMDNIYNINDLKNNLVALLH